MKKRYTLDLQLFAEQSATVDGQEWTIEDDRESDYASLEGEFEADSEGITIPDEEEEQPEVDDADSDEGHEESDDDLDGQEQDDPVAKGKSSSTANAVIAERRKWQERMKALEKKAGLADKIMKTSGVASIEDLERQMDNIVAQNYMDRGYDEQTATMLAAQQRRMDQMERDMRQKSFDAEVMTLKSDPFYADIDDWRDEFEPIAISTGQSLKDVYMIQRGRERMKEVEREVEQRMIANRTKKNKAKVDTTSGGGTPKKPTGPKLTPDQLAIAKVAGIRPEEYYKYTKK
ncbi:hypothetical protein [Paenibacillus cucumis (ex Kampfer et al. 2016)]|uniref:Scaffolding protein n=1 Tax=Paenibacillus cucumis (ex Kampfer et al. 2016) TaxID=1776858 RepID=A0ABS7KMT7_9BACL|nr:hypothetical protein [Paenibacillus cucumis (ex Kampfer et al. 2016)]MBY0205257.1 hypothetical protein [Paenibacillus cucumis (ex Kampfer et al. 2016)]